MQRREDRVRSFPEPSCALGFTEQQLEQILRADPMAYPEWADGKTQGCCEGKLTCVQAHGVAHHESDVARFKRAVTHERRKSTTDILAKWDLDGALPNETRMRVVGRYVAGELTLDKAIEEMRTELLPSELRARRESDTNDG